MRIESPVRPEADGAPLRISSNRPERVVVSFDFVGKGR